MSSPESEAGPWPERWALGFPVAELGPGKEVLLMGGWGRAGAAVLSDRPLPTGDSRALGLCDGPLCHVCH